jgi:hypothetical protein
MGEDRMRWESGLSWACRWGELTFRDGMNKEEVLARFRELDEAAAANLANKRARQKR